MITFPTACETSNQRPRPTTAASALKVCGANPYQSQTSMLTLNANPRTAATAASAQRLRSIGASNAPAAPQAPQPSICCGVQIPWPRKRFETNAASAPVATPARRPSDAPATIAITVTGCTPGTAANSTRPAAAAAASVATTASSRVESAPDSNHATPATTSAAAPSIVASAPSETVSAATSSAKEIGSSLRTDTLPHVELDDAVRDLRRPRQVVRDDDRPALRRLRAEQSCGLLPAVRVDHAG